MQTAIGNGWPGALGALEGEPQMAAVIELDGGPVRPDELQPMVGGVVDSGFRIAHDDDAGGNETARVLRGVKQHRQCGRDIDRLGLDIFLRGRLRHDDGRDRRRQRAPDGVADAAKIQIEGRLAIGLAAQQIADYRNVVAVDRREHQRRSAVVLFQRAGDGEMGVDRRRVGRQTAVLRHALQGAAQPRVKNIGI